MARKKHAVAQYRAALCGTLRDNRMDHSKEERIAARRLRIQQKLAMKQGAGTAGSRAAIIVEEKAVVRIGERAYENAPTLRALLVTKRLWSLQTRLKLRRARTDCGGCWMKPTTL